MNIIHFDNRPPLQKQAFTDRDDLLTTECLRCHRALKKIESRRIGYGPTCLKKLNAEQEEAGNSTSSQAVA